MMLAILPVELIEHLRRAFRIAVTIGDLDDARILDREDFQTLGEPPHGALRGVWRGLMMEGPIEIAETSDQPCEPARRVLLVEAELPYNALDHCAALKDFHLGVELLRCKITSQYVRALVGGRNLRVNTIARDQDFHRGLVGWRQHEGDDHPPAHDGKEQPAQEKPARIERAEQIGNVHWCVIHREIPPPGFPNTNYEN